VSGWHFAPDRPEEFDQALERVLATTRRSLRERGRDRLARLGMAEAGQVPPALLGSTSLPDRCLG
jgi:hypothetical protein